MRSLCISGSIFLGLSLAAVADVVRGTLLNDDDPYFIRGDDGNLYKAEWYGGSILFYEGDEVILTNDYGLEKMIDDTTDETADVTVEEISPGYPQIIPRPAPTPNFAPRLAAPSYPTPAPAATPKPTPVSTPTATPTLNYNNAKWPEGRMLIHPEHFVNTGVVNVKPTDTLKLRSEPGTKSKLVTEIPFNATDITAFDQDQVWDGDAWWCPVEWHGFRGYLGRHYLPTDH